MLSTRTSPPARAAQPAVAPSSAAVSSIGASRPTRSAADSAPGASSPSGPIRGITPALLISVTRRQRAGGCVASQADSRAAAAGASLRSSGQARCWLP